MSAPEKVCYTLAAFSLAMLVASVVLLAVGDQPVIWVALVITFSTQTAVWFMNARQAREWR